MNKAVIGLKEKLSSKPTDELLKLFLYAIVLIHEFAHARMDKQDTNLSPDESYYMEEPFANAIVLNYTKAFNKAERCPAEYSLDTIARKFIESQIYPYNMVFALKKVDVEKWIAIK